MKLRIGFVSNSSNTSFCIVGISLSNPDEKYNLKAEELGLDIQGDNPNNWFNDENYFGLFIEKMKDDETLGEFKQKVAQKLKELTGTEQQVSIITRGWYDG
jgi:hypothetical protein